MEKIEDSGKRRREQRAPAAFFAAARRLFFYCSTRAACIQREFFLRDSVDIFLLSLYTERKTIKNNINLLFNSTKKQRQKEKKRRGRKMREKAGADFRKKPLSRSCGEPARRRREAGQECGALRNGEEHGKIQHESNGEIGQNPTAGGKSIPEDAGD